MMRAWLAVALLAASWLPGLGYYQPASLVGWAAAILLGTALLVGVPLKLPSRGEAMLAVALLLPALGFMPWPYRMIPVLAIAGLVLCAAPIPRRWPAVCARGLLASAAILLVQSLAILAYAQQTARSHDLGWPWSSLVGAIGWLLGADTAVDGHALAVYSMREVQRIGITWELLLDPATWAFLVGGLTLLAMAAGATPTDEKTWRDWLRSARLFAVAILLWLPLRAGLIVGLLIHRALRTSPVSPMNLSDFLFSSWLYLALLAVPAVVAWRVVPWTAGETPEGPLPGPHPRKTRRWSYVASLGLVACGVAALTLMVFWDPIGSPQAGRVMVVERHSTWEPTTRPYDTKSYGEPSGYTFTAIYDYCSRFFEMSRLVESDKLDQKTLSRCDVLVIKTPTAPYVAEEVAAIVRFVQDGGGLLLIGEHTDIYKSSTYLNQVAEPLGFRFREDLLFRIGSAYVQSYEPPAVPHPAVAHLPPIRFAVTCSIDPGHSFGRAIIQNAGLWSLPPDYSVENYFPEAQYRADARYGSFIQLWGTRCGRGRVLAWTDSTIFSTFSTFEPGKPELMLGMLQWLNRRSVLDAGWLRLLVRTLAGLVGLAALAGGLLLAKGQRLGWVVLAAAVLLGWASGSAAAAAWARHAMRLPEPVRPMTRVAIDRTVSEVPLTEGGFPIRGGEGYGLLEQWIPRLGYFPTRRTGADAFSGNALVVICPSGSVSEEYRQGLIEYVAAGGRLLVLDAPNNTGSTANDLVWPFGLSVSPAASLTGSLHGKDAWPAIPVQSGCQVDGGESLLWIDQTPVAARARHGRGTVIVFGAANLLNDAGMGEHWMAEPNEATRTHFDLWYGLLRAVVEDRPLGP